MGHLSNDGNIPLSLAVWLAEDTYDHNPDPNTISVTTLMKSVRSTILGNRVAKSGNAPAQDIAGKIPSKMGTSLHDGIEHAWINNYKSSMADLGYPQAVIDSIAVNPDEAFLAANPDCIPVYLEVRTEKEVLGIKISGKFDFVADGRIEDFKSTGTYSFTHKTSDDKYILQMSIYRWLNPEKITRDDAAISFIFTDWKALEAKINPSYPQSRLLEYPLELMSYAETEAWVKGRITELKNSIDLPEADLPLCTDEELWRKPGQFRYYKDPQKALDPNARSTKNFDNLMDANDRLAKDGFVGAVVERKGQVGFCKYCPAAPSCSQFDALIADGSLKL